MAWIDKAAFSSALFLVVVGLIFGASGFGIFVVGRLDGVVLIIMGISMFWGGWVMSGARGASCAAAAVLNMFDAASTISFWNFEVNPLIRAAEPKTFLLAKIACSISIMLYAKFHQNPKRGGEILTLFFSLIVGWNLGQHALAYMGLRFVPYEMYISILGAMLSLLASAVALSLLILKRKFAV